MSTPKLLTKLDLMQPVVMYPALEHKCPATLMAYSDQAGRVYLNLGGELRMMDTMTALRLLRDLRSAVEQSAGYPPE